MPDNLPTNDQLVQQAVSFFFGTALPQTTGKRFADLPDPSVHIGAYLPWDGTPVPTTSGQSVTPAFALRVSPALPVTDGVPNTAGVAAPTGGPARHLLWLRTVADAAVDDAAEIQRVMADLDSFVDLFTASAGAGGSATPTGPAPGGPAPGGPAPGGPAPGGPAPGGPAPGGAVSAAPARAAQWAAAIVAARSALAVDLSTLTAVPTALQSVAPDVESLRSVLQHFFTYTEQGAYYPRWAGSGRDGSNPDHLTTQYKQQNTLEQRLERDRIYLYGMVPESVLTGTADLGATVFREFVIRFSPTGVAEQPFTLAAVHTVRSRPQSAPYSDFVFFASQAGQGIPVAPTALSRMSASLIQLVSSLTGPEPVATVLADSIATATLAAGTPVVHLVVTLTGEPTWPPGVISDGTDEVRIVLSPPEQITAIAALPEVKHLAVVTPETLSNDQARAMVNYPGLDAKLPGGKKGGAGVLVGVIDSGIDASHPAFAGRIHAVWDQGTPGVCGAGTSPAAAHPGNAAYTAMDWGVELTGAAVANSRDPNPLDPNAATTDGHGTHTAGTSAGAEVRDGAGRVLVPAGLAPQAKIAVVRGIQVDGGTGNTVLAVKWIFQKATELGLPCVINMSFGNHFHAHDGSDASSRAMLAACRDRATGNYLPGRILVASAGNERGDRIHLRRSVPANSGNFEVGTVRIPSSVAQSVVIWVKDPTGTCPVNFPLSAYVYRKPATGHVFTDVTRAIQLGSQAEVTTVLPNGAGVFAAQRTRVSITTELSQSVNGDHSFRITFISTHLGAPLVAGGPATPKLPMLGNDWGIVLINRSAHPLDVHLWSLGRSTFTTVSTADDRKYLVGAPAASAGTISVAAVTSRINWTDVNGNARSHPTETKLKEVTGFSSPGPLRESSIPPANFIPVVRHEVNSLDVAAPGCLLHSALSSQVATATWIAANAPMMPNNSSQLMQGTSMAAPVITGLVANMLSANPALTMPDVLAKLKAASTIPAGTSFPAPPAAGGAKPLSVDWGYGLVDAAGLVP